MDGTMREAAVDLQQSDPERRFRALEAIAHNPHGLSDWTIELLHASGDQYEAVKVLATSLLETLGTPPSSQLPEILAVVQRPADGDIVYWAVTLIGRLGSDASDAVPVLTGVLANSPFPHVRERSAWALGKIGPAAAGAMAVLQSAAAHGTPRLKRLASEALATIPEAAA